MSEEKEKRTKKDAEEVKEVLGVVSKEIPALIKGIVGSIFSEEAGRDMGKAAAAFYKELKGAGFPEETAVKMTENYLGTFTSLGSLMNMVGKKGKAKEEKITEEISKKITDKLEKKLQEEQEDEEED